MRLKKLLSSISSLLLIFSLAACNSSSTPEPTPQEELEYSSTYSYDDYYHWKECITPGHEGEKSAGECHSFKYDYMEPTYEQEGYRYKECTICGYRVIYNTTPKLEHNYASTWSFDSSYHWHACIDSGYENLKADNSPHDFSSMVVEPTYEEDGYTIFTCQTCGYEIKKDEVPALNHNYSKEWNSDETYHWQDCIDSGYEDLYRNKNEHNFVEQVVPPTAEEEGYTTHVCSVCGRYLTYTITWKDWDDTILREDKCQEGLVPSYGSTPEKDKDDEYEYVFTGWSPSLEATYSDAIYVAQYSKQERTSFTVLYNSNGGDITPFSQVKAKGEALMLTTTTPRKEGHTFIGWNNIYEDVVYYPGSNFTLDKDVILWAMWEENCVHCYGTGISSWNTTCSLCNGEGERRRCYLCGGYSMIPVYELGSIDHYKCANCGVPVYSFVTCTNCDGKGYLTHSKDCPYCDHVGHFGGDAPTILSIGATEIVLNTVSGFEYSKDLIVWQSSPVFENLTPSTSYTFYQRRATSGNVPFGETSKPLNVTTESS